ncbi:MAG: SpvB/TcaC N-terminal domain-containing protein [Bacteroidales bacterium]
MTKQFAAAGLIAGLISFSFIINRAPEKNNSGRNNRIELNSAVTNEKQLSDQKNQTVGINLSTSQPALLNEFVPDSRERVVGFINEEAQISGEVIKVWVNDFVDENSTVLLEYDLFGVSDFSSVCKSVNDQLSTGGCFVKKNEEWTSQSELINPKEIRQGMNIIRFNISQDAKFHYRIKNVRLTVNAGTAERNIFINQSKPEYYNGKFAYIQGFTAGNGSENATIRIDGKTIMSNNGVFEGVVERTDKEGCGSWSTWIEAEYADGEKLRKEIRFEESVDCDYIFPLNVQNPTTYSACMPGSRIEFRHDGVVLSGIENTINAPTTISATTLRNQDIAPMNEGLVNVTGFGKGYRLLPHSSKFNQNLTIRLKYDSAQIPAGYSPEDIFTFYYNEETGSWEALERDSVDTENQEIISYTNHFTDFINGVIKAPEMPEVQAYTPTSIKDLKAADPLAGVQLINAPTANNMGTATTGLPIEVPAGRAGMQPQLSIQYSSAGGNSWMGLGWNIQVPEISVETRWGVPRYDATNETESYLYAGEELTPQVQRSNYVARGTATEKQFYPRVEGAFNKIVRHGTSPSNYYWTVTDKSGTVYYFGETAESRVSTSAGIARWELCRIEDVNGNSVIYQYETKTWSSPGTIADGGKQIYLKKIIYTGVSVFQTGKYWVDFILEDPATVLREDIQVSYRYGFKEVTGHRLSNVVVNSNWGEVSRYVMTYTTGEFGKSLLTQINHFVGGSSSTVEKKYNFEYFSINERDPFFNSIPDTIALPDDDLKPGTLFGNPTAIGNSKSWSLGGGLGGGIGIGHKVISKNNSINLSYGYDETWTKSHSALVDINGDGLPDKLFRDGDDVYYHKMEINTAGEIVFNSTATPITSLTNIGKDRSRTNSTGLSLHAGLSESVAVNIAGGYSRTKSISKAYFSDANSDGLIDFIEDGVVYYNSLVNGVPVFTSSQSQEIILGECDTIFLSNGVDENMFEDEEEDPIFNKKTDVVRMWVAPYSGAVVVGNSLHYGFNPANNAGNVSEWIKFSIEHNNSIVLIDSINTQNTGNLPVSANIQNVQKGDKIFFRLFDRDNVNLNEVYWQCSAYYSAQDTLRKDADNKKVFKFESNLDYTTTGKSLLEMPFDGQIRIQGSISAPALSDTVRFQIKKNDVIIKEKVFLDNVSISYSLDTIINIDSLDKLQFFLYSTTQVEWSAVSSPFEVSYTVVNTTPPFTPDPTTENGTIRYNPIIEYSLFPNDYKPSVPYYFGTEKYYPTIHLVFSDNTASGQLSFSIKWPHDILKEYKYTISQGNTEVFLTGPSFNSDINKQLFFDIYTTDTTLAKKIISAQVMVGEYTYEAGVHTVFMDSAVIFGNLNRDWGQFTYSPEIQALPIDPLLLTMANVNDNLDDAFASLSSTPVPGNFSQNNITTGIQDIENLLSSNGITSPLDEVFGYMYLDMEDETWKGLRGKCLVDEFKMNTESLFESIIPDWSEAEPADPLNPGNVYENETLSPEDLTEITYSPYPVVVPGTIVRAVNRITKSDNYSLSVSAGPTILSAGLNGSISTSDQVSDFMDMNGDGFPDVLSSSKIQYTTPYRDFEASA